MRTCRRWLVGFGSRSVTLSFCNVTFSRYLSTGFALWKRSWPLVPMLPIAAATLAGQVQSRPSSRVRSPGNLTGAIGLRPQTALTGSARSRTIPQREQGRRLATDETPVTSCMPGGLPGSYLRASRPALAPAVAGAPAGAEACAPWRRRGRPVRAALKPYRKFSHALWGRHWAGSSARLSDDTLPGEPVAEAPWRRHGPLGMGPVGWTRRGFSHGAGPPQHG